jgi:hypothetical protein
VFPLEVETSPVANKPKTWQSWKYWKQKRRAKITLKPRSDNIRSVLTAIYFRDILSCSLLREHVEIQFMEHPVDLVLTFCFDFVWNVISHFQEMEQNRITYERLWTRTETAAERITLTFSFGKSPWLFPNLQGQVPWFCCYSYSFCSFPNLLQ